jgi:hypothetical protein
MGTIFEVRGEAHSDSKVIAYGARRTRKEAEQLLRESRDRVAAAGGQVDRWWIEVIDTTGLFEIPARPTPRERFTIRVEPRKKPGNWQTAHVDVLDGETLVTSYDRNYAMLQTFEPFRQGARFFALVAPDYTATSVLDLQTGQIIASEEPSPGGFCPVGFYVPDWWDVHDGTSLPGSMLWKTDNEWPSVGDFGFVWGCLWGDDSSWKVQYLDLSEVHQGRIRREERFGYLRLATRPDAIGREFIRLRSWEGNRKVEFALWETYDLTTGGHINENPWD